jgi:hypothetical protein
MGVRFKHTKLDQHKILYIWHLLYICIFIHNLTNSEIINN